LRTTRSRNVTTPPEQQPDASDHLAPVVPTRIDLVELVNRFLERYPHPETRRAYDYHLWGLFSDRKRHHPANVTEEGIVQWATEQF